MTVPFRCVLDTNICIKQFINDPLTPKVNQLFDHLNEPSSDFYVPDLFYIECANVFWKYVRSNLYTIEQVEADLEDLKQLRFQIAIAKDLMTEAVQIGLSYGITAYDACYVSLSRQANAPLLTLDQRLVNSMVGSEFDVRSFTNFDIPTLPSP
jgi:predicted nucleic acid-binding protein